MDPKGPGGRRLTRPIRVARIITRLNVGGPAIQALLLDERLDPSRYQTLLVAGTPGRDEGDMLALRASRRRPVVVPSLVREIRPALDLGALIRLVRILRSFAPDVVHTHLAKAGALGRVAARLVGAPVVVHTFHGNVLQGYFGRRTTSVFVMTERALALMSTRIIAISGRQRAELEHLRIGSDRIVEIPLGFDLSGSADRPAGAIRRELALAPSVPLVGIVARLVPIKRVDVFLDAAAALRGSSAHFILVGDGELRARLREQARERGIADRVHFLGWRADVRDIYADLDVVVQSSDNEGTPVSIIEALAAARPVVATAVGGVPDLVDATTGTLVAPRDPHALAAAIAEVLADPAMAAGRARAGQERVLERHDAARLVERIDGLYRELLSQRSKM